MARALAELTTLRVGGPPRRLVEAPTRDALRDAVRGADAADEPALVLAGGSNVVVADAGFAGTVALAGSRGIRRERHGDGVLLTVEAGEPWDALVEAAVAEELAGIECLAGIPGSVGAAPIQNVGAYGQDVSETIVTVLAYDRLSGETRALPAAECGFSYRSSAFKRRPGRWVVLAVTFRLDRDGRSNPLRYAELASRLDAAPGDRPPLSEVREAVLALRRAKGMVIDPTDPDSVSAGSFFTNPVLEPGDFERLELRAREHVGPEARPPRFEEPDGRVKTSAAWLIERAGFQRGYGDPDGAAVSSKHTLALTNRGGASAAELVRLAREIAGGVAERFGVELVPEPVFVGHDWEPPHPRSGPGLVPARSEPE